MFRDIRCMRSMGKHEGMPKLLLGRRPLKMLGLEIPVSARRALYSVLFCDCSRYSKFSLYSASDGLEVGELDSSHDHIHARCNHLALYEQDSSVCLQVCVCS